MDGGRGEAHVLAHQPRRFGPHAVDVEKAETRAQLAPHEHVAPDRLLLAKRPFLIDRLDAEAARLGDRPVVHALAVEVNFAAGIGGVKAHHDLDQGRFARAVVAEQADDLPPVDLEVDAGQRTDFSKRLGDVSEFDDRRFAGAGRRWLRHASPAQFREKPRAPLRRRLDRTLPDFLGRQRRDGVDVLGIDEGARRVDVETGEADTSWSGRC